MRDSVQQGATLRTTSDRLMETLCAIGVDYIFANLGSDHPPIIEALAKRSAEGLPNPKVVVCPHEMVAISAAHGYAQATGRAQAVLVHVDVGTQNLGGGLHNALRGRVPMLILAGASPVTLDGELRGSRNEFIHYLQDVPDQRGIVREYTKWSYDLHVGHNVDLVVKRAMQIANSEPKGPVYIMAPREILEEEHAYSDAIARELSPVLPSALSPEQAQEIATALAEAKFPLVITSYLGRNHDAVRELIGLSEEWAIPVIEAGPMYMNFPADHPMHLGYDDFVQPNPFLPNADVIVVLDSDFPWLTQNSTRQSSAKLYWVDADPIKETIPLWYYSGQQPYRADAGTALRQIRQALSALRRDEAALEQRRQAIAAESRRLRAEWEKEESIPTDQAITPEYLTRVVRELCDEDTIVVNETITNYGVVWRHLRNRTLGSFYGSGGSSLGWHGGAAIGVKLAHPTKTVIALTGDGSYLFSVPSAVHLTAAKYGAPFLTVIYNNGGWKAPKASTLAVHPDGYAQQHSDFKVNFYPDAQLERAAAVVPETYTASVKAPEALKGVLTEALAHVRAGHSAVVNVVIKPL